MYEVLAGDGKRWMTSLNCMLPPPMTSTCFQGMGAGGIKIVRYRVDSGMEPELIISGLQIAKSLKPAWRGSFDGLGRTSR